MPAAADAGECAFTYDTLEDLGCGGEGDLRSAVSDDPVELTLINRSVDRTWVVHWVDFEGARQEMGRVGPRSEWSVRTFATHPFVISDAADAAATCQAAFLPHAQGPAGAFHAIKD